MRVGCLAPPHRKTHFGCVGSGKAHPAPLDTARMCLSVRHGLQNASFRRMRFFSPGQTSSRLTQKRILPRRPHAKAHFAPAPSRKSAFCSNDLTQKRILRRRPHAKPHSGGSEDPRVRLSLRASYRMRFSVRHGLQNALFRRVRFSSPGQTSSRLTQKRILRRRPHAKAHSAQTSSRKSAFCPDALTQKRTLPRRPHGKPHSGGSEDPRVRLSVRTPHRTECVFRSVLHFAIS